MRWGSRSISPHILLNDLLTLRVTGVVVVTAVRDESGVRDVVVMLVATYIEWHLRANRLSEIEGARER